MSSAVRIRGLYVEYPGRKSDSVAAVNGIDLTIEEGAFAVLLGPSGCGKSTVLNSIAGLIAPTAGTIDVGETTYFDSNQHINIRPEQRGLGMVFQSYALWPHMTVFDNVAFPLRRRHAARAEVTSKVKEILDVVRCGQFASRYPHELSGGQQQRIALARALVAQPPVILFDEPLSNLDAELRVELREELALLHSEVGFTGIYVTHDQAEAYGLATKMFLLREGKIEQSGVPLDVYMAPRSEYVASFLGANSWAGTFQGLEGSVAFVDSEFGPIRSSNPVAPMAAGDGVVVTTYPDRIRLEAAPDGLGRVVSKRFGGSVTELVVASVVEDGDWLRIRRPAENLQVEVGDRVNLVIDPSRAFVFAGRPTHASDHELKPQGREVVGI